MDEKTKLLKTLFGQRPSPYKSAAMARFILRRYLEEMTVNPAHAPDLK
jgi:hypothetical protein